MNPPHPLLTTWDEMIRGQVPNFLRLYLSPAVAGTCLCLDRYVRDTWAAEADVEHQSFLANSFDEALSGAIKLARFSAAADGRPKAGLVIDPDGRLGPLASITLEGKGKIEFIPDLVVVDQWVPSEGDRRRFGFVVVFPSADPTFADPALALQSPGWSPAFRRSSDGGPPEGGTATSGEGLAPLVIACVSRASLDGCRREPTTPWRRLRPDVVVFDESFVRNHVPFGAFTARKDLYDLWNRPGLWTFHSTTFQPNTVSTLHFLRCLEKDDPEVFARLSPHLERIERDPAHRRSLYARQYSPSLARASAAVGWDVQDVRAAGHYVTVKGRQVFDGVAGVACSIRGHNPAGFRDEIERLETVDARQAAAERLGRLTGLGHVLPAVSGASAVENALRLGLAAQFPKKYVLAFTGGFGGKTLLALTGTASASCKRGLDPLYENVLYVDPFRPSAIDDLEAALDKYPVGVVQLELIQAVGGVRPVPERVVRYLQAEKRRRDYLLFVDEVQTGMYRTGPFVRSRELGVEPDLLTIGKGTSDMMFPFAVTLYSDLVRDKLRSQKSDLADLLRKRVDCEYGWKTLVNVLDHAEKTNAAERVREMGGLFRDLLGAGLSSCRGVRDVRVFGLLVAVELETRTWPRRWLRKQVGSLYAMSLLRYRPFPVLTGYCQYEPHVLKFTPPLSVTREEVLQTCEAFEEVLRRPAYRLVPTLVGALARSSARAKWEAYWNRRRSREPVER